MSPQLLIKLEATEKIGAGRYERIETRTTHRNGNTLSDESFERTFAIDQDQRNLPRLDH